VEAGVPHPPLDRFVVCRPVTGRFPRPRSLCSHSVGGGRAQPPSCRRSFVRCGGRLAVVVGDLQDSRCIVCRVRWSFKPTRHSVLSPDSARPPWAPAHHLAHATWQHVVDADAVRCRGVLVDECDARRTQKDVPSVVLLSIPKCSRCESNPAELLRHARSKVAGTRPRLSRQE